MAVTKVRKAHFATHPVNKAERVRFELYPLEGTHGGNKSQEGRITLTLCDTRC
jgi:hypothetical protein